MINKQFIEERFPKLLFHYRLCRWNLSKLRKQYATLEISKYAQYDSKYKSIPVESLRRDIFITNLLYDISPQEYFLMGFTRGCKKEKEEYLSDIKRESLLCKYADKKLAEAELDDKYCFYKLNSNLFHRQILCISNMYDNLEEFINFFKLNQSLFIKPNFSSCGRKTNIYYFENDMQAKELYKNLIHCDMNGGGGYVNP